MNKFNNTYNKLLKEADRPRPGSMLPDENDPPIEPAVGQDREDQIRKMQKENSEMQSRVELSTVDMKRNFKQLLSEANKRYIAAVPR